MSIYEKLELIGYCLLLAIIVAPLIVYLDDKFPIP